MSTLASWPWWVILLCSLLVVGAATFAVRWALERLIGEARLHASAHAGPLMPTLGALFAFLTGFVITTTWGLHTATESTVAREAAATSTLAWASTAVGVDTTRVQGALSTYLEAVTSTEWPLMRDDRTGSTVQDSALQALERTTRAAATAPGVTSPEATEMLRSIDDISALRHDRLDAASRTIPLPLLGAIAVSGLVLCVNASILSLTGTRRSRVVTSAIVLVVSVDLAVLLILAGPFRGTLQVSETPLVTVQQQLDSGYFSR